MPYKVGEAESEPLLSDIQGESTLLYRVELTSFYKKLRIKIKNYHQNLKNIHWIHIQTQLNDVFLSEIQAVMS